MKCTANLFNLPALGYAEGNLPSSAIRQVLADGAVRAGAVPLKLVTRVADLDAAVVGRADVRAGLGAGPGRVVVHPALVVLGLVGEAVRQVVALVVGARGAVGARADGLHIGNKDD